MLNTCYTYCLFSVLSLVPSLVQFSIGSFSLSSLPRPIPLTTCPASYISLLLSYCILPLLRIHWWSVLSYLSEQFVRCRIMLRSQFRRTQVSRLSPLLRKRRNRFFTSLEVVRGAFKYGKICQQIEI